MYMSRLSIWQKKDKKKSECTCHWKACSAFSGCFCSSFIHSVCTIYDHAFGVYIGLKESVIKGVIKAYIILCTVHYLLLIIATFSQATLGLSCLCYEVEKKDKRCVSLSAPLWTRLCIRCNLCLFFLMIQTCSWL